MQKDHFDVHVFTILVQKVLQEMRHRLVRYVTTHDDVSDRGGEGEKKTELETVLRKPPLH